MPTSEFHRFSKNPEATSEFKTPELGHEASSIQIITNIGHHGASLRLPGDWDMRTAAKSYPSLL